MGFLAPLSAILAGLSIPIILLYMLRLRRTEMRVSSNFLWRDLVRDREANAPWQRLRFSWLLLLQLLILAALVLALMRPFAEVQTVTSGRIVLLLDASASMQATDVGESRFEQAQEEARAIINTLSGNDEMTIIRVASVPEVLVASSDNKTELRSAVSDAEVGETAADWAAALTLAGAGASGAESLDVVILSDGGLPDNLPPVPGEVRFITIGASDSNVALTALSSREVPGEGLQVFAQMTNFSAQPAEIILSIELDGELYSAERYNIPANDRVDIITDSLPDTFDTLQARLTTPANATRDDFLPTDDAAFAVRQQSGINEVLLVTPRNLFLSQLFNSVPGIELSQASPEAGLPSGEFDLYIFDGFVPDRLPDGDLFILNPPTDTDLFNVDGTIEDINQAAVTNLVRDNPITEFLDFANVNIRAFQRISSFEEWATPLIQAEGGPLLIAGEVDDRQVAVLSFALQNSDLPLQIAYPILMANLIDWYTPTRALLDVDNISAGEALVIRPVDGDAVRVILPDDNDQEYALVDSAQVVFGETAQTGIYTVEILNDGDVIGTEFFAVNLFDAAESQIQPQESITIGTESIAQATREQTGQRELWQILALIALMLLMMEWIYYHRLSISQRLRRFSQNRTEQGSRRGL